MQQLLLAALALLVSTIKADIDPECSCNERISDADTTQGFMDDITALVCQTYYTYAETHTKPTSGHITCKSRYLGQANVVEFGNHCRQFGSPGSCCCDKGPATSVEQCSTSP